MADMKFVGKFRKTQAGLTAQLYKSGLFGEDVVITRNVPEFLDELTELYPDEIRVWLTRLEARKIFANKDALPTEEPKVDKLWYFPSRHNGPGHRVTLVNGQYNCTCEAAGWGKVCWAIREAKETMHDG
jgi:hypothetical protein